MRKLTAALTSVLVTVLAVLGSGPSAASAAPMFSPSSSGTADFAVSTSSERLLPDAQGRIRTHLTVANNSGHELVAQIRSAGVLPRDDGQIEYSEQPDPAWSAAAEYPSSLKLAAHTFQRVPVSLTVPSGLLPDIYLLGFVVEAQATGTGIRVYHQIGALLQVELPGPRERRMEVEIAPTGMIHLGSRMTSSYLVRNTGPSAALGRGQVRVDSRLTDDNVGVYRGSDDVQLFPTATSRTLEYAYEVHGLFLIARPKAQILYGGSNGLAYMAEDDGRAVLIIPWLTLILLAVTAVLLSAYWYWYRRRREMARRELMARPKPQHRRTRTRRNDAACAG
ncbi:COG1470 family protein [Actinoplanes sp. CA-252034]|uniref:COG1470 family protein n=1 Tax=Actinoplanes sp. CA-252034 TaxID=3239906 RepID=UPI003D98DD91